MSAQQPTHDDPGERGAQVTSALRDRSKRAAWRQLLGGPGRSPAPLDLREALGDDDFVVRRRAAVVLRVSLGKQVPGRMVLNEPFDQELFDAVADRVCYRDEADEVEGLRLRLREPAGLEVLETAIAKSPPQRARIAAALLDEVLTMPSDPGEIWRGPACILDGENDFFACWKVAVAAMLDEAACAAAVERALAGADLRAQQRMLLGFGAAELFTTIEASPLGAEVAERLAPSLESLLDHDDALLVDCASAACCRVVKVQPRSPLAQRIGALARAALQPGAGSLAAFDGPLPWDPSCPTVDHRPVPTNAAGWYVLAACAAGEQCLVSPLLDELRARVGDDGRWRIRDDQRRLSVLRIGAAALAPHLQPDDARALAELLAPTLEEDPWPAWRMPEMKRETLLALAGVLPAVPDEGLSWFLALATNDRLRILRHVDVDRLGEARADMLIRGEDAMDGVARAMTARLYFAAPARLAEACRGDSPGSFHVRQLLATCASPAALSRLVKDGHVSAELILGSNLVMSLSQVAELVKLRQRDPVDCVDPASARIAIDDAAAGTPAVDLAALRELVFLAEPFEALEAVHRATQLGDEGRALAVAALERLIAGHDDVSSLALIVTRAVELGMRPRGLPAALAQLREQGSDRERSIADAAALRFEGVDVRRLGHVARGWAIEMSRIDVDVATVTAVLEAHVGEPDGQDLGCLMRGSPATIVATLLVLGGRQDWSQRTQDSVVDLVAHDDAKVRLAAYRALATRDAKVWPCALLVHEAVFDPDPAVRRFGESLRR